MNEKEITDLKKINKIRLKSLDEIKEFTLETLHNIIENKMAFNQISTEPTSRDNQKFYKLKGTFKKADGRNTHLIQPYIYFPKSKKFEIKGNISEFTPSKILSNFGINFLRDMHGYILKIKHEKLKGIDLGEFLLNLTERVCRPPNDEKSFKIGYIKYEINYNAHRLRRNDLELIELAGNIKYSERKELIQQKIEEGLNKQKRIIIIPYPYQAEIGLKNGKIDKFSLNCDSQGGVYGNNMYFEVKNLIKNIEEAPSICNLILGTPEDQEYEFNQKD